ncbi:hypothetical protein H4S07_002440 [Coemansia furcata]|uniref:Uncharacterized protein n=1 Tax=Coemansia furcata TaxID=417177 RepID=A0ACC1LKV4_9FUNG|nr:hypothetical protein H4S07_002440 [Coemansia furcata]
MTSANKPIHAVADPGAAVTLVTHSAAKCLGLHITTKSKPHLLPLWEGAQPYQSISQAHIMLQIDGSPVVWTHAIVVDMQLKWDMLVGQDALKQLGIMLMMPAMLRHIDGAV